MLFFLVPRRFWPVARVVMGVVLVALGIAVLGRITLVIGAAFIVWGFASGISRRRQWDRDDDRDGARRL